MSLGETTAGPHYPVNYPLSSSLILRFIQTMRRIIQSPVFNVKYSMSGILLYVPAFIYVWSLASISLFL